MDIGEEEDDEESCIGDLHHQIVFVDQKKSNKFIRFMEKIKHQLKFASKTQKFHRAIWEKDVFKIRECLSEGVNVNSRSDLSSENYRTSLQIACLTQSIVVVRMLLDKGADVNATDSEGETPLHYAKSLEIASLLLQKGALIEARDKQGWTPLHTACFQGCLEVIQLLLSRNVNVNAQDADGCTPLHRVCERADEKRTEIAGLLLSHNADINAVDKHGSTPLHSVCDSFTEDPNFVKFLLRNGANVDAMNKDKLTARDKAKANKHYKVVELLEDYSNDRGRNFL